MDARDKSPRKSIERQYWDQRIEDINLEIRIIQSRMKVVTLPGDGGPDEQRRLTAKEDWKREADEYA